ncbi:hypothetical protein DQ237_02470 [Blastococcus sp. TF02-8]|uniref:DUF881 domain-containing protein n=1 Tax=Blastococcus sp. TF02-8 TaxID=2250574 RepID=UPI000DE80C2F|nr:DUF881 domain-containing protein [Blastococcus sp. TF02-8]RBY97795.1 hypothetical protein DQ237_02470 [Blastococcus sp. TF02-8]
MDGEPTSDGTPPPPPGDGEPRPVSSGGDDAPATPEEPSTSTSGPRPRSAWNRPTSIAASTVLALVLGFALTVQIRSTDEPDNPVAGQREEDLVLILDEIDDREEVLRRQIADTRQTLDDLTNGQEQSDTAVAEAQARAEAIGVLNGTLPARGPGLRISVQDDDGTVPAAVLLDAIQELRGAGAEAIQVDDVRVVVSSAVTGSPGSLRIDGTLLEAPYEIHVIGPTAAMEVALNVAGGVVDDVRRAGGTARVTRAQTVSVDALVD